MILFIDIHSLTTFAHLIHIVGCCDEDIFKTNHHLSILVIRYLYCLIHMSVMV